MPKEPTLTIPELIDPQVPGSGEYTAKEALAYLDRRAAHIADQRQIVRRLIAIHEEAVKSDAAKGDEDPEVTAKIEEAAALSYDRIQREFQVLYDKAPPAPHVVRDASLLDLLDNFDSYDADQSGGLSIKESRLSEEVFKKLAPEGELTPELIKRGISVESRPDTKGKK